MAKIFKCDVLGCPERYRCLDKDEKACRCGTYRVMHSRLWVYRSSSTKEYQDDEWDRDKMGRHDG